MSNNMTISDEDGQSGVEDIRQQQYRILMLAPVAMPSHMLAFKGIANALSDKGHQITVVTPWSLKNRKIREIVIPSGAIRIPNAFTGRDNFFKSLVEKWIPSCLESLAAEEVQALKNQHFDMIILMGFFSECFMSLIHHMQVPWAWQCPVGLKGSSMIMYAGNPFFWSFMPGMVNNNMQSGDHGLTYFERIQNTLAESFIMSVNEQVYNRMDHECRLQDLCSSDMPPIKEILINNSLLLINGIQTMTPVGLPVVQSVVYTGGIHLKPPKPLPDDLEEWASQSGDSGFIFFSMGSVVKPSDMPDKYKDILIKVFASLDQRVLWKWDADHMEGLSENVRLAKWIPQQDVLGHPKLRLFITHGGFHSTQEALYNGVPVLGLPLFSDQHSNMADIVSRGLGLTMDWNNFTVDAILEKIIFIMNSDRMKQEAKRQSAIIRDQFISPEESVNFWVEYVIRHKGAHHLKSPVRYMSWYHLYNMDVWLVLAFSTLAILLTSYKIMISSIRFFKRS